MATRLCPDIDCVRERWATLARGLEHVDGLTDVMNWAMGSGLPVADMDIVTQDEYTHDAILESPNGFFVFGIT